MHEFVRALSDHPLVAITFCFVLLVIFYFLFKKLIKLALIIIIIAVAVCGYYYFENPKESPADFKETLEKARAGAGRAVEKGKEVVESGRKLADKEKEVVEKSEKMVDRGKAVLEKWVKRGKAVIAKVKEAAGEIGKIFGEKKGAGKK